ncbi:MAG: VRR-NUC domain-containing protein [Oscillospiraceae bacterium]
MNPETKLQNEIRVALSDYGMIFRTNAGDFWQGKRIWSNEFQQYVLTNLRPIKGLPTGFSDTFFVGGNGKTAFIEIKTPTGTVRPEQENFIKVMKAHQHYAGIVRSVDDALKLIGVDQ